MIISDVLYTLYPSKGRLQIVIIRGPISIGFTLRTRNKWISNRNLQVLSNQTQDLVRKMR